MWFVKLDIIVPKVMTTSLRITYITYNCVPTVLLKTYKYIKQDE